MQFVEQYEPVVAQLLAEVMDPTFVCTVSIAFGFIECRLLQKLCWNQNQHAECSKQALVQGLGLPEWAAQGKAKGESCQWLSTAEVQ